MLTIYGRRSSANVMKPLWAADELGVPFEQVDVGGSFGGNDAPEYLARNPNGLVPTIDDDGFVLWESNAITRYLAAQYGAGSLWPEDPARRAQADRWMDWTLTTVMPMMTPVFWNLVRMSDAERDDAAIAAGIRLGNAKVWPILEAHLADHKYVAGDEFSMGDIPLGPQVRRWRELVPDRNPTPNIERWFGQLLERPAFQTHVMIPVT